MSTTVRANLIRMQAVVYAHKVGIDSNHVRDFGTVASLSWLAQRPEAIKAYLLALGHFGVPIAALEARWHLLDAIRGTDVHAPIRARRLRVALAEMRVLTTRTRLQKQLTHMRKRLLLLNAMPSRSAGS